MSTELIFEVDGKVATQGSKNRGRGRAFYEADRNLKPWRARVIHEAKRRLRATPDFDQGAAAYRVSLVFILPRPKRHHVACDPARPLRGDAPRYCSTKPDCDKAARAVLDALTQADVYADDARVVGLSVTKLYTSEIAPRPGVLVQVAAVPQSREAA